MGVSTGGAAAAPSRRRSVRSGSVAVAPAATPSVSDAQDIASAQVAPPVYAPSREEIAQLAYSYWEARGGQGGSPEEDWVRAERELGAR